MGSTLRPSEQTPSVASDTNFLAAGSLHRDAAKPVVPPRWRVWVKRIAIVVFVALCIEVGIVLTILPWYGRVWTDNSFMLAHPALRALAAANFVRGLVTGLGLVDIWLGIWEAARYREPGADLPVPPAMS